jgi:hypothetical protein
VRLKGRITSLERAASVQRGACGTCGGAGRAVFSPPLRAGGSRGGPCPSCGRSFTVRFVDMLARGTHREAGTLRGVTPCA